MSKKIIIFGLARLVLQVPLDLNLEFLFALDLEVFIYNPIWVLELIHIKEQKERERRKLVEMKSSRRDMEKRSEISCAIEELSVVVIVKNHESPHIPIKPFLSICYLVLQVLGEFIDIYCCFKFTWMSYRHLTHCYFASNR